MEKKTPAGERSSGGYNHCSLGVVSVSGLVYELQRVVFLLWDLAVAITILTVNANVAVVLWDRFCFKFVHTTFSYWE